MATATKRIVKTGNARLWVIPGGAGPGRAPVYVEYGRPGTLRWGISNTTNIEVPDGDRYDSFIIIDEVQGAEQQPQLGWVNRMVLGEVSIFRQLRDLGCPADVQVHYGVCENPRDFNGGFQMAHILEEGRTDYNTDDLGALASGERNPVNENGTFTGRRWIDVVPITFASQDTADIDTELVGIAICDSASCEGECGAGSDGCQKVFVVQDDGAVFFTDDGGSTWEEDAVDGLSGDASGIACVGQDVVVISEADAAHYWASRDEIIAGGSTWQKVTLAEGYVTAHGPRALFSLGATLTWIVGAGGYVYFSNNIESEVEVQDAGNGTTEDLNAVMAIDALHAVAVGDNNALIHTSNGGASWASLTGPASGQNLNGIWMRTAEEWIVTVANGAVWYTEDSGATWKASSVPSGGAVNYAVAFSTRSVGWLARQTSGTKGQILRTIDGGHSWVLPTGVNAIGANDKITQLAVCGNANRVWGAGLADDASAGYLTVGA